MVPSDPLVTLPDFLRIFRSFAWFAFFAFAKKNTSEKGFAPKDRRVARTEKTFNSMLSTAGFFIAGNIASNRNKNALRRKTNKNTHR